MLTHCSGAFTWRPCGSVQNSMLMYRLAGGLEKWGKSVDNVRGNEVPLFVVEVYADF